jgi:hypothetical protein
MALLVVSKEEALPLKVMVNPPLYLLVILALTQPKKVLPDISQSVVP